MPDDCDCDYCRAERGQLPLRRTPSYGRNVHRPVSAERIAQGDEYIRQCLAAIEAKRIAYENDALHRLALAAVEKDVTLVEFELAAGAAYERARAYSSLQGLSLAALRYLEAMHKSGPDDGEASDAWYDLTGREQDAVERYLKAAGAARGTTP